MSVAQPEAVAAPVGAPEADAISPRARRNVTFQVGKSARTSLADGEASGEDGVFLADQATRGGGPLGAVGSTAASRNGSVASVGSQLNQSTGQGSTWSDSQQQHNNSGGNAQYSSPDSVPLFSLTREDVQAAFEFFDVQGTGSLTMASLKPRLSAFYPNLTSKEYRFLLEDPVSIGGGGGAESPSACATSSHGNPNAPAAAGGFTVEHLWELIDTYQRLYARGASTVPTHPLSASTPNTRYGGSGGRSQQRNARSGSTASNVNVPRSTTPSQSGRASSPSVVAAGIPAAMGPTGASAASGSNGASTAPTTTAAAQIFDPIYEAFRVYDPSGKRRCVDTEVLAQIMARIGYGELSEEELKLLVRTADFDGDGKISLDDFRQLVTAKGRLGPSSGRGKKERDDSGPSTHSRRK